LVQQLLPQLIVGNPFNVRLALGQFYRQVCVEENQVLIARDPETNAGKGNGTASAVDYIKQYHDRTKMRPGWEKSMAHTETQTEFTVR